MQTESTTLKAQIVYLTHGGGPLPLLGDEGHRAMVAFMQALPAQLRKPAAILVVSAHWEADAFTVQAAEQPSLFYDYYGFPPAAYEVRYPAAGSPEFARRIADILTRHGLPVQTDLQRGFDHGLFIPLKLMYPQADIPAFQLSLLRGLDPTTHLELGKALRELTSEHILVIGSGFSFHNMAAFQWRGRPEPDARNDSFQDWLIEVLTGSTSQVQQWRQLANWQNAPEARYCHPREEHLLPLHVCAGMANRPARLVFDDTILGKRSVAFLWA